MASLFETILEKTKQKKRRIGITIIRHDDEIFSSLKKAQELVDVVIYGEKLAGFECVPMEPDDKGATNVKADNIGRQIVKDYKDRKIDQFVRGQVDDFGVKEEFRKQFNIPKDEPRLGFGLMQDVHGREIFLTAASNPDAQNLEQKIAIIVPTAKWVRDEFGVEPKIAVMATCRPGSYGKDPVMSKSFDEAEALVEQLKKGGYEAKNVHIELEKAIEWGNILMPANGTIGNQIFRSLLYLGGGKNLATPSLFPGKGIYEDDSRNEKDWYPHLIAASAWAAGK